MFIEKNIKKNYDLASATTFRLSAQAQYFVMVKTKEELIEAINWAKAKKLPLLFLGGGSNVLVSGKKIRGLVIKISGEDYMIKGNLVSVWAGTNLTKLAKASFDHGLSGLEWAFGVPGSLGGAVRGNAGAYGSDISQHLIEVEAYDLNSGKIKTMDHQRCGFRYRHSIFKQSDNLLILSAKLKLSCGLKDQINKIAAANLSSRLKTKPKEPSAGCIFKNLEYKKLIRENRELAQELKAKGLVRGGKIGVAYLISQLGLKGVSRGGAKISEQHANFIVNASNAKSQDIFNLINLVKKKIKARYKINLEEEVQHI